MLAQQNNKIFLFFKNHKDFFACVGILLFAFTLLRSAFYGTSSPDESFYLTIPYRLIKGDALLIDEWHASQFSAFLLYLPMKIFLKINGSTDGIILFFRCLFVFCQTVVSFYTYHKLKKYSSLAAFVSSAVFLLYVTETVNMLDYYTMSLMGFQVVTLVLFCSEKLTPLKLIFCGIVFACVVVAQPFNCIVYFLFTIAVTVFIIIRKKKQYSEFYQKYLSLKSWIYITIGIVIVAAAFFVFILTRMTLSEFFSNLGNIFGGHDHTLPFADTGKTDMFSYLTIIRTMTKIAPYGFYITVIVSAALIYDKKRLQRRKLWILIALIVGVFLVIENIIVSLSDLAATLFRPYILTFLTFITLMLTKKKDKNLFLIFGSGFVYILFLGIISQALDYVGVIGLVISNCAFMPSLKQLYYEILQTEANQESSDNVKITLSKIICIVTAVVVVFDIASGTAIKFSDNTMALGFDRTVVKAEVIIADGPLKGIHFDNETAETYYKILDDVTEIKNNSCEKVFVASLTPWIYFCFEDSPATFTTWYIEEEFNLYEDYYKNKNHIPQCIYIPNTEYYYGFNYADRSEIHKNFFSEMFNLTQVNGKAGYIMYVNK